MIAINEACLGTTASRARTYAETMSLFGMSTAYVVGGSDEVYAHRKFEGNELTSDPERWQRTKAVLDLAPALGLGSPTVGWLKGALFSNFTRRQEKPAIIVETGGGGRVTEQDLANYQTALGGLTRALGMLPGAPPTAQDIRGGGNASSAARTA